MTRRRLLGLAATTVAGGVAALLYAWQAEPEWLEFTEHTLFVKNLALRRA